MGAWCTTASGQTHFCFALSPCTNTIFISCILVDSTFRFISHPQHHRHPRHHHRHPRQHYHIIITIQMQQSTSSPSRLRQISSLVLMVATFLSSGIQADNFPAQSESEYTLATFTLSNIARANFGFYRDSIARNGGARSGCGAVTNNNGALEWSIPLKNAANTHSNDMLNNGCFSHNSCVCNGGGCDFASRIQSFYGVAVVAENIANGQSDALTLVVRCVGTAEHSDNLSLGRLDGLGRSLQEHS